VGASLAVPSFNANQGDWHDRRQAVGTAGLVSFFKVAEHSKDAVPVSWQPGHILFLQSVRQEVDAAISHSACLSWHIL